MNLDGNSLELPEERALVVKYDRDRTAANVVAYFSQRLEVRAQRSLLLLCKATLFLLNSGQLWCRQDIACGDVGRFLL